MAYIVAQVVQGGADAFAIENVETLLLGERDVAYQIDQLEYEITNTAPFSGAVAAQEISLALSRYVKTAMPSLQSSDLDVIKKWRFAQNILSAVGVEPQPVSGVWVPPGEPLLIVQDPIYWMIDSTGTGNTLTANLQITYTRVRISQQDRLAALADFLNQ